MRPMRRSWPIAVGDRVVEDAVAGGSLATAKGPDPGVRLGQVDQGEVEREGADHGLGRARGRAPRRSRVEAGPLVRIVVRPQGDRPAPDPLDEGEQLRPGLLRDDLPEQGAEQPDLGGQRVAGAGRPDAGRFRGDGCATVAAWSRAHPSWTVPSPSRHRAATVLDGNLP